jgi:integrase/recombinase XerD
VRQIQPAKVGQIQPAKVRHFRAALTTQTALRSIFRHLAKAAGMDGRLYPYLLRHTAATELLRGGASLEVVRLMLGHTSYNITQRYLTLDTGDLAKAQHRSSVVGRMK